jgi:hypothetical protein
MYGESRGQGGAQHLGGGYEDDGGSRLVIPGLMVGSNNLNSDFGNGGGGGGGGGAYNGANNVKVVYTGNRPSNLKYTPDKDAKAIGLYTIKNYVLVNKRKLFFVNFY